jgi:hypothetical protein
MGRLMAVTALWAVAFAHLSAVGQNANYSVMLWSVSSIDPQPADCADRVASVRDALSDLSVPSAVRLGRPVSREFSWVVVCNERTWFNLKNSPRYARVNTISAMTDFADHVVFLNGFGRDADALRDSVAHEMGHILCECADERQADRWQLILLHEAAERLRQKSGVLTASR